MLARIGAAIEAWDALQKRWWWRVGGVIAALIAFVAIAHAPIAGLDAQARTVLAATVVMSGLWVGQVLPLAVTALLPLAVFPLVGLGSVKDVAVAYMQPMNFLMLGGFVIGHAVEAVGLHHRFAYALLRPAWVRASPRRVLFAVMVATAGMSGFLSNTATALLMMPLGTTLAALALPAGRSRTAFPLGVAYAASIGGCLTLIGTPPNIALAKSAADLAGRTVTFAGWLIVGVPFVALALPLAFVAIAWVGVPVGGPTERAIDAPAPGPWTGRQIAVLTVVVAVVAAWLTRAPIAFGPATFPGWGPSVGLAGGDGDAWVAIVGALVLFFIAWPSEQPFLVDWHRLEGDVPWGVLLLFGGGFALADAIEHSTLDDVVATAGAGIPAMMPAWAATLLLCAAMVVFTEFVSNTAAALIALPILAAAAKGAHVDPLTWMIPATIAASCGFMMPSGTGPNALACEAGGVRPADMAWAGLLVNVICVIVAALVGVLAVPWM